MQYILPLKYDCICLCETWLSLSDPTDFQLTNYTCFNKPRKYRNSRAKRGGSGGIILYIHKTLSASVEIVEDTAMEDRLWIKFKDSGTAGVNNDVFCCFYYAPPANSIVTCNGQQYLSKGSVVMCGDLNSRI